VSQQASVDAHGCDVLAGEFLKNNFNGALMIADFWQCDVCREGLWTSLASLRCAPCNFDLCYGCAVRVPQPSPVAPPSRNSAALAQVPRAPAAAESSKQHRLVWRELGPGSQGPAQWPSPRNSHGACTNGGGLLYVYGGRAQPGRLNDLWEYNCETGLWQCLEPSNKPGGPLVRSSCLMVHDRQDSLYVGFGLDAHDSAHNHLYRYSLRECMWTLLRPVNALQPPARRNSRGWFYRGAVWVFGGSSDGTACLGDLWCYDTNKNLWTQPVCSGPVAPPSQGSVIEVWKGSTVVIAGGAAPAVIFHTFDCATFEWRCLLTGKGPLIEDPMPAEDTQHFRTWDQILCANSASAIMGDTLLIWGGTHSHVRHTMWSVDLSKHVWTRLRPDGSRSTSLGPSVGPIAAAIGALIPSMAPIAAALQGEPQPKCYASGMAWNYTLFLFGGWTGAAQTNELHALLFPDLECKAVAARQQQAEEERRRVEELSRKGAAMKYKMEQASVVARSLAREEEKKRVSEKAAEEEMARLLWEEACVIGSTLLSLARADAIG
jgi:hypothetical protein